MKEVIISITGSQDFGDGLVDTIELITTGEYSWDTHGRGRFSYEESELTGLEGTVTSFTVEPHGVTMEREGILNTLMVFELGRRHMFLYETPYGSSTMGVDTRVLNSTLGEHGGDMELDYTIDLDHTPVGRNRFVINVREKNSIRN